MALYLIRGEREICSAYTKEIVGASTVIFGFKAGEHQ
jgi:hypothetical protein